MSEKVLRLEEANTLYKDLRKRISDSNQRINTKLDDAEVADGYLILKAEGQPVVRLTGFGGSGGGGGGGGTINNAKLTFTKEFTWNTKTFSDSSDIIIPYSWSSIEGGTETGPGTLVVVVNNTEKARIAGVTQEGGRIKTINVKPYLVNGPNTVRLTMIDIYENQSTISFTVNIVSYKISSPNFIDNTVIRDDTTLFQYIPVGSGLKTVYFDIDGITVGTVTTRNSGTTEEYYVPTSNLSFGSHRLEVYFTVQLDAENPDSIVYSNRLTYSIIYQGTSTAITISSSHPTSFSVNQYETISIPYVVYNPNSEKSVVEYYVDGEVLSTINVSNLVEEVWTYVVRDGNPDGSVNPFTRTFEIRIGDTSKIFTATIVPSEIMIEPVTSSLALYLTAQNRSNNEPVETRTKWEFKPSFADNISCDMQGFNWLSNGWMTDVDGNPILRISNGASVTIPYEIFGVPRTDEVSVQRVGRTIEIEFATSNVNDYDTTLFKCYEDTTSRGVIISAQKASLTAGSILETQYKENEHIRLSFVITPTLKDTDEKLQYCYIDGIMSGVTQYTSFSEQLQPKPITIGSDEATIDIYNIRVYETALTRDQIVNNWIADMANYDDKLAYYEENNIFEEGGGVSYNKLPTYLPYMTLNVYDARDPKKDEVVLGNLPPDKGKKRKISGTFIDPTHPEANFSFSGCEIDIQGTSSKEYPVKNYKLKFKGGFVPLNEKTANVRFTTKKGKYNKFRLRDTSIAESTFTFKADYASSEGANNVELVRFYNDTCTYRTPPQQEDQKIIEEGGTTYLRRQGIDGFPMVMFAIYEEGATPVFMGKYNFNNDKGTEDTYGLELNGMEFNEDDDTGLITISHDGIPDESWEMGDNNSNYNRFTDYPSGSNAEVANALLVTTSGDGDSMYEVRFPGEWQDASDNLGNGAQIQIARTSRFRNVMQWLASTDTYDYDRETQQHPRGIKYQYIPLSDYKPYPIVLVEGSSVEKYYIKQGDTYVSTVTSETPNPIYDPSQTYYIKEAESLPNPVSYSESYVPVANIVIGITNVTSYYEKDSNGQYVLSSGAMIEGTNQYSGLAEEGVVYYEYTAANYYYDNVEYRMAKFSHEFNKYFNLTDAIFYYIFTELFLMIDSRVKNSFPTYYADVSSRDIVTIEKVLTTDEIAQADTEYFYKDVVYNEVQGIIVNGSNVFGLYKVDTESSTPENTVYVACAEDELASLGVIYYNKNTTEEGDSYTVTKDPITYPSDVSEYYISVDSSYMRAENPPQESVTYYSAIEDGDFIKDESIQVGNSLSGHRYYVNQETTDTIYTENTDSTGWPLGRWCWLPYDMDTALGINNRGKLAFTYSLEDIDYLNVTDGTGIYNGQDSVMWTNMRKCFYTAIRKAYADLRVDTENGLFSYKTIEDRFTTHQRTWPAKIWNEDAYNKYIYPYLSTRTDAAPRDYLAMCLGDKSQQRKWWLYNRFRYLDSKYSCGDSGDASRISFRAYNRGKGVLKLKPYSDIYLRFRCGKAIDEQYRGTRNEFTTFNLKMFSPKETETYIYSGDQIIDIRGLNEFAIDNLDISKATKLQYLYVDGYHHAVETVNGETTYVPSYENTQFDKLYLLSCKALKELSAKDNVNFSADPHLENCKDLKYVNLLNTKVFEVTFPDGGVLERVYLPSGLQSLVLKNQKNITDLHIMRKAVNDEEYDQAEDIDKYLDLLDEEDNAYCKYVEDMSSLAKVVFINVSNAIQDKMLEILYTLPAGSRIRYDGFDFTMNEKSEIEAFIAKLDVMRWIDATGADSSAVGLIGSLNSNTLTLSYEDVSAWKNKYKDLNFKYNIEKTVKLYDLDVEATNYDTPYYETTYTTFNTENGSIVVPEVSNSLVRPHRDDIAPVYNNEEKTWTNGTHFTFIGWSTQPNQTVAEYGFYDDLSWSEIDEIPSEDYEISSINTSLVLYPVFRRTPIYSVNFYNFNGTELLGTETRIDSGDIDTEITQSAVTINSNIVEVLGWGSEPYGAYSPNIIKNVSNSFDVYSILDWPITSLRIAQNNSEQLYYNNEVFDTSSVVIEAEKRLIDDTNTTVSRYLVVSDEEYSYVPNGNLTYEDRKITFSLKGSSVELPIGVAYSLTQSVSESGQPIDPTDAILDMVGGVSEDVDLRGLSLDIAFKFGESNEIKKKTLVIENSWNNSQILQHINWTPKNFTKSGSNTVNITLKKDPSLGVGITVYVVPERKSLENASWSDIQAATYAGYAENWWSLGEEKTVVLDSTGTVFPHKYFTVRIVGFDHNTEIETSGKKTITFQFANTWNDDPNTVHKASDPEYQLIDGENVKVKYDFGIICPVMFPDASRIVPTADLDKKYLPTWLYHKDNVESFECIGRNFCMDIFNLLPEEMRSVMIPTKKYQLDLVTEEGERVKYVDIVRQYIGGNNITFESNITGSICGEKDDLNNYVSSPIFIPSIYELTGDSSRYLYDSDKEAEYCKQYEYFKENNVPFVYSDMNYYPKLGKLSQEFNMNELMDAFIVYTRSTSHFLYYATSNNLYRVLNCHIYSMNRPINEMFGGAPYGPSGSLKQSNFNIAFENAKQNAIITPMFVVG